MQNCDKCRSDKLIKHGIRKNKYNLNQVYLCKSCGKFITNYTGDSDLFKNKTYQKEIIIEALKKFCDGYSYDKIANLIEEKHKYKISKSTIYRWVNKIKTLNRCKDNLFKTIE